MSEPTDWPPFFGLCPMDKNPCIGTACASYRKHRDPGWGMTVPRIAGLIDVYPDGQISVPGHWEARCAVMPGMRMLVSTDEK